MSEEQNIKEQPEGYRPPNADDSEKTAEDTSVKNQENETIAEENIQHSTPNIQQNNENMEVHHHGHVHEKKKWKEYLFQFIMLFLAVFLGFLAEFQLEQTIERHREKEYIISMIEDAKTDTANLQRSITINTLRAKHLDTLGALCLNYNASGRNDNEIFKLSGYSQIHANVVRLTERTIQQLKNAGGMRLIKSKPAIDSIILYDES